MNTPYNTGKVRIGCNYQPPARAWVPSRTELMLQESLLAKPAKSTGDKVVGWALFAGFVVAVYFGVQP